MDSDNTDDIVAIHTDSEVEGVSDTNADVPENVEADLSDASDAPSDEASEGTTFEELAQKKGWSSPDDLAKAYRELESQNKRVEMDRASLLKIRQTEKRSDVVEEEPTLEESGVLREVREMKERLEIKELFDTHKDAGEYSKRMADFIKENPHATWESAYRFVKFEDLEKRARDEGRQEAYQNIEQKKKASGVSSGPKTKKGKTLDELVRDKDVPLSEIEKMLTQ